MKLYVSHRILIRVLILLGCGALLFPAPAASEIYAAPPQQQPTPTIDETAEAQANLLEKEGMELFNIYGKHDIKGALEKFTQAIPLYHKSNDRATEALAINNVGVVYHSQGQYRQALAFYFRALTIFQDINDRIRRGATLDNIGGVYASLGQDDKAIEYFTEAAAFRHEAGQPVGEGGALNNIGLVYYDNKEYDQALAYFEKAQRIWQDSGEPMTEAVILNSIGSVYAAQEKYGQALKTFRQGLDAARKAQDQEREAEILNNMGLAFANQKKYPKALDFYQQAFNVAEKFSDIPDSAVFSNIGSVYEEQGELQKALDYFQRAITIEEDYRVASELDEFKIQLASQSVGIYQHTVSILVDLGRLPGAFEMSERARARTFLDQLGNTHVDLYHNVDPLLVQRQQSLRSELTAFEQALRQERAQSIDQQDLDLIQKLTARLADKQNEYKEIITRIQINNPEYSSLVNVTPITLAEIQGLLNQDTTLLDYFVTDDKTFVFIITANSLVVKEIFVSKKELVETIQDFRSFPTLAQNPPSLEKLYTWLVRPLKGDLKTRQIGIIPNESLHYLPFAALSDGARYFGDDYSLFYLPSASVFKFVHQKEKSNVGSLLAIAQSKVEGYPILRYAEQEAENVAQIYNTQALIGSSASRSVFLSHAGSYNILHIAAHAELNSTRPLFSRILLAPDAATDGAVEVQDIYGLDLKNAGLVVLSACETHMGTQSAGDDLIGLNRAFIYAGSPSVIASLWSVNDEATSILMTSFYSRLKQGLGKAEALRAAQAETRTKFPHPYYWAGFVLTGDPGETNGRVPTASITNIPNAKATVTDSRPSSSSESHIDPFQWLWIFGALSVIGMLGLIFWRKRR